MKKISFWFRATFGFNRKEMNGFLILSGIMVMALASPLLYATLFTAPPYHPEEDEKALQSLLSSVAVAEAADTIPTTTSNPSKSRRKYVVKQEKEISSEPATPKKEYKKFVVTPFDMNKADTTAFKQIRGIGSKLSQRIVAYRDKLGGFISQDQLKEVYGLDSNVIAENSSLLQLPDPTPYKKIAINTATVKELIAHPYITYKKAIAIANYRDQHGPYSSLKDVEKIHLMTTEDIAKLAPYLSFD